ncbi:hypothetical protein I5E65_08190, partial [Pseudomonas aeruginosa]|uniref:hypothetical protein n=3 Tax=Pseudomonas aeruginosa group TaxID=136841 RepID=UPI0018C6E2BB
PQARGALIGAKTAKIVQLLAHCYARSCTVASKPQKTRLTAIHTQLFPKLSTKRLHTSACILRMKKGSSDPSGKAGSRIALPSIGALACRSPPRPRGSAAAATSAHTQPMSYRQRDIDEALSSEGAPGSPPAAWQSSNLLAASNAEHTLPSKRRAAAHASDLDDAPPRER